MNVVLHELHSYDSFYCVLEPSELESEISNCVCSNALNAREAPIGTI